MEGADDNVGATNYGDYAPRADFFGGKSTYRRDADGLYSPPAYLFDELSSEYDDFLTEGPTVSLTDNQIGMDGTVKHFIAAVTPATASTERLCDYIEDRYGNRTTLAYSNVAWPDGTTHKLLSTVTDPSGRQLVFTWTNLGTAQQPAYRITSVTGPAYIVTYDYNAQFNLSAVHLDPAGLNRTTTYTYTSYTGANGTATGLLASVADGLGNTVSYSYNLGPLGAVWCNSVTEPAGLQGTLTWNVNGSLNAPYQGGPSGSYLIATVSSNTTPALSFYCWSDLKLRKVYLNLSQYNQNLHRTQYDDFNNVIDEWTHHTVDHPPLLGAYLSYTHVTRTFGPHGNELTSAVEGTSGSTTNAYYDGSQYFQKSGVTDFGGHASTFGVGSKTDTVVGNRGSVLWVRDARYSTTGKQFSYSYDSLGRKSSETNLNDVVTNYSYGDQWGNLTNVVQGAGAGKLNRTTQMVYDAGGRVLQSTDPAGRTSVFTYNVLGQPLTASFPATANTPAETVTYTYAANGRLSTVTDNRGTTTLSYEPGSDRVSSVSDPVTGAVEYTYNKWGQRLTMTLPGGGTWSYLYDNGRMMPKDDPNSVSFVLHKITDDQGRVVEYETSDAGQLQWAHTNQAFNGAQLVQYMDTLYTYDTVNPPTNLASRGFLKRIQNLWRWKDAQGIWQSRVLTQNDYTYNSDGMRLTNLLSDVNGPVRTESYGYDELHRLTSVNYGDGQTQTYAFDAMGNRTQKVDSVSGTENYTYNAANMLLTRGANTYTNDMAGNTLTGGGRTNTWDSQNRLAQCVTGSSTSTYTYAADGLRHRSVVGANTTDYVLDLSMFVREKLNGAVAATYLVGPRGPEYRRDDQSGQIRWYCYDGLGSVLGEVDPSGNLTASRSYDVYGVVRTSSGTSTSKHKYVGNLGHPSEDDTGLIYMQARYVDPSLGRFVSEDPAGDGYNWYSYTSSNPVCNVDPSGEFDIAIGSGGSLALQAEWGSAVVKAGFCALGALLLVIAIIFASHVLFAEAAGEAAEGAGDAERTADEIISADKKGGIRGEFPKELLDKTMTEINKLAKAGNRAAQTARKLLTNNRFNK